MLVEIQDVSRSDAQGKNGKSYGVLQVAYRSDGKLQEKKIMSFSNPQVFKTLEAAKKGDTFDIKTEKDGNGYWQWVGIGAGNSAPATSGSDKPATTTRVTGSNYETPEERSAKQKYIVKQSSLSVAANLLSIGAKIPPNPDEVIALANKFVEYVFTREDVKLTVSIPEDLTQDIPD